MKRALLIAGGTVGGLGAVLAITPPQFTSSESAATLGGGMAPVGTTTDAAPASTTAPAPAATKSATPAKTAAATNNANATSTKTTDPTPAATKSAAAASPTVAPQDRSTPQSNRYVANECHEKDLASHRS